MKLEKLQDIRASDLTIGKLYSFIYKDLTFNLEKVYTRTYGCFYVLSCKAAKFEKRFSSIAELKANISFVATSHHKKQEFLVKKQKDEEIFIGDLNSLTAEKYIIEGDINAVSKKLLEDSSMIMNELKKKIERVTASRSFSGNNRIVRKVKKIYEKEKIRYILETPFLFTKIEISNLLGKTIDKLYYQSRLSLHGSKTVDTIEQTMEKERRYYIECTFVLK